MKRKMQNRVYGERERGRTFDVRHVGEETKIGENWALERTHICEV